MIQDQHIQIVLTKLANAMERYQEYMFEKVGEVPVKAYTTGEHLRTVPRDVAWEDAQPGYVWGGEWLNTWFVGKYTVDQITADKPLFLQTRTGAVEAMLFVDDVPKGLYNESAGAAYYSLGSHHTLQITSGVPAGTSLSLALEAYAGHFCAGCMPPDRATRQPEAFVHTFRGFDVVLRDEQVLRFVIDLRTLLQLAQNLPITSFRRAQVENVLIEVSKVIIHMPQERRKEEWLPGLSKACELMAPSLAMKNGEDAPYAALIGHSHMDTAWLWPVNETIRKCARTYALALSMMEQYPEYKFIQSSVLHGYWMEKYYPVLFERIKQRVAEGRWEPNGGVWVECDCNVTGGEAMVRQFLRGQLYTRSRYGYTSDTFWLPDTFGYSAAIPQILKGVDIRYFCTTKLSWNDTNRFPFDTFLWKGIDGTGVMAHFNTTHSWPDPQHLLGSLNGGKPNANDVQHKRVNNSRLVAYGFGDGGGGPMFEMIESSRRVADLNGCPRSSHSTISDYLHKLEAETDLPLYEGELYLELHRGTLTQRHDVKRNNRRAEIALRQMEIAQCWARLNGKDAQAEENEALWDVLLMNQFHDILPGTCITEVYQRTIPEMEALIQKIQALTQQILSGEEKPGTFTLMNPLSWQRKDAQYVSAPEGYTVKGLPAQRIKGLDGEEKLVFCPELPSMSSVIYEYAKEEDTAASRFAYDGENLTTPFAQIRFDEAGRIASMVDLPSGRELVKDIPFNTFYMGEDVPALWDCWDINIDTIEALSMDVRLLSREVISDGCIQFRIRSEYAIGPHSRITQDMIFHANSPRVDFETIIDWKDPHHLLKVGFDADILSPRVKNEIQFGYLERPTTRNNEREQAMFEVCNHKWSDLSENRFGLTLINDCKYGMSCLGSNMMLTLHKGGTHPDQVGDVGVHKLTYSILPHQGGFAAETVVRPAYELNMPALMTEGEIQQPCLLQVDAPNVILEAVKPAEEGCGIVYRLYECERSAVNTTLTLPGTPAKAELTNLLEDSLEEIPAVDGKISLHFRPFEINTVKVTY